MNISVCMHAMNRAWQVKQTLRHNVDSCEGHELILANYGSTDDLDSWVHIHFAEDIKSGRLVYFFTSEPSRFHASKSKNLAHHLATGDIVFNCDGDNFVTKRELQVISEIFTKHPGCVLHNPTGNKADGTWGRIAIRKTDFDRLGGYDEGLLPVTAQDDDLIARALQIGLNPVTVVGVDRIPVQNQIAQKTSPDCGLDYHAVMAINLAVCYNRQKVMGPIREKQSAPYRGLLNLATAITEVSAPEAEARHDKFYAVHPALDPGGFMNAWLDFGRQLSQPASGSMLVCLQRLQIHWGDAAAMAPESLRQIQQAARLSQGPILVCASGLSSFVLAASTTQKVVALEADADRYRNMEFMKRLSRLRNLQIIHTPLVSRPDYDWYGFPVPPELFFALVICNGPSATTRGGYKGMVREIKNNLAPGFSIFLEDAEQPGAQETIKFWADCIGNLKVTMQQMPGKKSLALIEPAPNATKVETHQ